MLHMCGLKYTENAESEIACTAFTNTFSYTYARLSHNCSVVIRKSLKVAISDANKCKLIVRDRHILSVYSYSIKAMHQGSHIVESSGSTAV